jgi:hypothetical protein
VNCGPNPYDGQDLPTPPEKARRAPLQSLVDTVVAADTAERDKLKYRLVPMYAARETLPASYPARILDVAALPAAPRTRPTEAIAAFYPGGIALRFARLKGYRDDKPPAQADTIESLRVLLHGQVTVTDGEDVRPAPGRRG